MIGSLIRKEFREHRVHLTLLWILGGLVFALKLGTDFQAGTSGSFFSSLRGFLVSVQIILTFFLCERLIHREYRSKTQLFLEALPLRRVDMLQVKFFFALTQVILMVLLSFLVCAVLAYDRESLTLSFLGLLILRALMASFFWFSFIFMMSLLGKFRVGLYVIIVLVTFVLDGSTAFDWLKFAPMDLLSTRFAFEREVVPWASLGWTLAWSLGFCGLGFALALVREGSVATLLAEKMSHREKIFVAIAIISTLMVVIFVSDDPPKEPFEFEKFARAENEACRVDFAVYPGIPRSVAEDWAHWHLQVLDELRLNLDFARLPNSFLMMRRDFDGDKFERSDLQDLEGVVLLANFDSPEFQQDEYQAWLTREILMVTSKKRAGLEARRWILDGFALFSPNPDHRGMAAPRERILWMRAAFGVPQEITQKDLEEWFTFRSGVGDPVSAAVAWSALKTLEDLTDETSLASFFKAVLAEPVPEDFRALLHEKNHSVMKDLKRFTGIEPEAFVAAWNDNLHQARLKYARELATIPRLDGRLDVQALSGQNRSLTYAPLIKNSAPENFTEGGPMELRFQVLPLLAGSADPQQTQTVLWSGPEGSDHKLPGVFHTGQRVATTLVHFSPVLACEVIGGWSIREVE